MNHLGTKILETERLILRPFTLGDADAAFRNWEGDPEVSKYLVRPAYRDAAESARAMEGYIVRYKEPDYYDWAVVLKSLGEPIGGILAHDQRDDVRRAEVGYNIGSKFWGQGYATEAFRAVIRFFFEEVGYNRIEAAHDARNPASGRVMEKCGLRYEGTRRQAFKNNAGIADMCFYGILAEDYFGCQSCGVPCDEAHRDLFGTEPDGRPSRYCVYCRENGAFTEPDITLEETVELGVPHLARKIGEDAARAELRALLPTLERWRKGCP